ncbi:chloroplast beta-amylase [Canna indica]|uniref:Beta-amylase n=1 Tax=Canna indica TaxID=4628 RepID=A0AAQ3JQR5_9LILI|nr:chloroplast beta-amylase [Canna indica]
MELGVMTKQAAAVAKPAAFPARSLGFRNPIRVGSRASRIGFGPPARGALRRRAAIRIARQRPVRSAVLVEENSSPAMKNKAEPVRIFVGLPLDTVSAGNEINHSKAIAAGLRALALLGVHGVDLPISWGVASNSGDWSSYLTIANMARDAGLRLRVSLHLHADRRPSLPLPQPVDRAVAANPDLLFTDRSGRRRPDCLSFAVEDLPVLDGKTPMEAYEEFFQSFRVAFADFIGSTITNITIGLGANGELCYPSFPPTGDNPFTGVGEFQCYDKYMLADLKRYAEESGNPLWGLSGPHDAPEYNQSPYFGNFFKDHGGSWETPYGQFFLSWYSGKLLSHGDRLLSIASKVFGNLPVTLSAKVPLLHQWHNTRSRPAELTAGFFNTDDRDGYEAVAQMFAKNSCTMIIPGMDLAVGDQLVSQIMQACKRHGVRLSGENSSIIIAGTAVFSKIKEHILANNSVLDSFTYQRMGAEFFSPEHWPLFTQFVRSMAQQQMDSDDVPSKDGRLSLRMNSVPGNDRELQAV